MEIVQYHNDINKIHLAGFKDKEIDILFTLLFKFKDRGADETTMTFQELKELADHKKVDRFVKDLESIYTKILKIVFRIEENGVVTMFTLFNKYVLDKNNGTVSIKINDDFKYLLNDLNLFGNFTLLDLKELVSLNSGYSKTLYRLLKQWDTTRVLNISIEKFRDVLGIPESYQMFNIDQRILEPCLEELKQYFKGLKVKKIKRGVKVVTLEFTWRKPKEEKATAEIEPVKYKYGIPEGMEQYRNGSQKDIYEEIEDREAAADQQITEEQEKAAIQKLITVEAIPKDFLETMKKKNHQLYIKTISKYIE